MKIMNLAGLTVFLLLALVSCSNDELAGRKSACALYVKLGVLAREDSIGCASHEQTFRAAALNLAAREAENTYPILLETTRRTASSAMRINRADYPELAPQVFQLPTFTGGTKTPPQFYIDMEHVTFDPPTDQDGVARSVWQVGGLRKHSSDDIWTLDVSGIGPEDFEDAKDVCFVLAYSSNLPGCSARVYVHAEPDLIPEMPELKVMAIEFIAPTIDEVRQIFLENEMAKWAPRSAK